MNETLRRQIGHIDVVRRCTGVAAIVLAATMSVSGCSAPNGRCGGTEKCLGQFGTINGSFREAGGPAPGFNRPLSGTITVRRGGLAGPVAAMVFAHDGRFRVSVGIGVYGLVGTSPSVVGVRCANTSLVDVRAFATTDAAVVCSIK